MLRRYKIDPYQLKKDENELLDTWSAEIKGFIRDGCADPEQYAAAPVKLLFILKEVNGGSDWDLRENMRNGCRPQTWNVVARWIEGIFHIDQDFTWKYLENDNEIRRKTYIPQVCALNLKKTSGKSVAVSKDLYDAAERDKLRLKQQIELYHSDIIILCGTESLYQMIVDNSPDWKMTQRGIWYYIEANGTIVISFSHPEARTKESFLYYGLIDAVKEIQHRIS